MQVPGERVRVRLRLVVEDEAAEVAPARIAAQLDEAGAEHQPERQPAQQRDHERRRRVAAAREGMQAHERRQEDREEARLEQQDLPAVAVEEAAGVHVRHVEEPEPGQQRNVGEAGEQHQGAREADPSEEPERRVRVRQPEERRQPQEGEWSAADRLAHPLEHLVRGQQAARAEERLPLPQHDQERDHVDEAQQAKEEEAREPVRRSGVGHGLAGSLAPGVAVESQSAGFPVS